MLIKVSKSTINFKTNAILLKSSTITCLKAAIKALERIVKYVLS